MALRLFAIALLLVSFTASANTGFLSNGTCFETAQQATDDFYSRRNISVAFRYIDAAGLINVSPYFVFQSGQWNQIVTNAGVITSAPAIYPNPQLAPCLAPSEQMPLASDIAATFAWGFGAVTLFAMFGFYISSGRKVVNSA